MTRTTERFLDALVLRFTLMQSAPAFPILHATLLSCTFHYRIFSRPSVSPAPWGKRGTYRGELSLEGKGLPGPPTYGLDDPPICSID